MQLRFKIKSAKPSVKLQKDMTLEISDRDLGRMFDLLRLIAAVWNERAPFQPEGIHWWVQWGNPPERVMRSLAERFSTEPKKQAADLNLRVEWKEGGGTGVVSLQHTGFTSAAMALTSTTLDWIAHVIGEVIQKWQMSQHGEICLWKRVIEWILFYQCSISILGWKGDKKVIKPWMDLRASSSWSSHFALTSDIFFSISPLFLG